MKKCQLIEEVSRCTGVAKDTVRAVLNATAACVRGSVQRNEGVYLFGLGILSTTVRGERRARNINTGEVVVVPPRRVPIFKPSESLAAAADPAVITTRVRRLKS